MKVKSFSKFLLVALAMLAIGAFASTPAYADPTSLVFTLDVANSGLAGSGSGPYATVTFAFNSVTNSVDVTLQGLSINDPSHPGVDYSFFGKGAFVFNAAAGLTISGVTSGYSVGSSPSGQDDGFGSGYTYSINGPNPPNAISTIQFNLSNGGNFTSANWITQLGLFKLSCANISGGCYMAAQIAPYAGSVNTGFAGTGNFGITCTGDQCGNQPPPPTPEPASMLLVGTGLVGMGGWLRRKAKR